MANKDNLENYFKEMNYKEYVKRMKQNNGSISKKIKKELGEDCLYIYKKVNAFTHPFVGPVYGLSSIAQDNRNAELLTWLTKSMKYVL